MEKTLAQIQFEDDFKHAKELLSKHHAGLIIAPGMPDEFGQLQSSEVAVGGCSDCLSSAIAHVILNDELVRLVILTALKKAHYIVLPSNSN